MCGRYQFNILDNKIGKQIKEKTRKLNLFYKQGEIFPSDNVLCIIPSESKIDLTVKKWGIKAKSLLINARMETIDDRLTYKAIKNNRCAVICNGFYEWDKNSIKHYISTRNDYIYLACIFNEANELVIITTNANNQMNKIHNRMPIIMNRDEMLKYIHNEDDIFVEKELIIKKCDEFISLF